MKLIHGKKGEKPFTDQTDGGGRGFTHKALQPGCWPGAAWLLGFHSQDFVREATPTTIGLIGKGFFPFFSMNELHGFLGVFSS